MKKFCFLIDTSFDFNFDLGDDVYVLPPEIIKTVKGKETILKDRDDVSRDQIRQFLKEGVDLKTSQTPYGVIQTKIEELLTRYEKVYCIVITKDFSGMYNTYNKIADLLEKKFGKNRIFVIDSKATTIDQNWILDIVREEALKGSNFATIEKRVKTFVSKICGFTVINNATQLIKGGRLTGIKALLVKALNIKLLIRYMNGGLKFVDKAKDLYTAIDKGFNDSYVQLKIPKNKIDRVVIFSDLNEQDTKKYTDYVVEKLQNIYTKDIVFSCFPTIVVTHLGDESFSVMFKIE